MPADRARLDRWLSVHVAGPVVRATQRAPRRRIPILMYHAIDHSPDTGSAYYRTTTTPSAFERHLRRLRVEGFRAVRLSDALAVLDGGGSAAEKLAVLTFDDGLRDFSTTAFPLLQAYGFPATVFVATGFIAQRFLTGRECMTAGEIEELAHAGVEIGSHTVTHRQLLTLSHGEIARELSASRHVLEDITGHAVALFSYPYAFPQAHPRFTRALACAMREHGYRGGVTTVAGSARPGTDPLFLPRLPMNDADDDALLHAKLSGAYDWMHVCQRVYQNLRLVRAG